MADTNGSKAWMAWMLAAMFAMTMSASGAVYSTLKGSITANTDAIEKIRDGSPDILIKIAELKKDMEYAKAMAAKIEQNQQTINENVSRLLNMTNQNTSQYRQAMRDYQALLQELRMKGLR